MPEYSNNSHYTENSINHLKQDDGKDFKLLGNDPKKEKGKLEEKINREEVVVGDCDNKARLMERIAGGSFGEVYLGELVATGAKVAVKIEPQNTWIQPTLLNEGNLYRKIGSGVDSIPRVYWFGFYGCDFAAMILDLLGSSLYNLWVACEQEFTMKTMLMVVDQMVASMQQVHARNCIHRDISPNNFAIGPAGDQSGRLYIFDFGQAQKVAACPQFLPGMRMQRHLSQGAPRVAGTPRFSSVFSHLGQPPSYRDDMEAMGYVWIYLLKGRLPWQGVRADSNDLRLDMIGKRKLETPLDVLCDGLPVEFNIYMNYVRSLAYLEMPDYAQIREMFRHLANTKNIEYDWQYDWLAKGGEQTVAVGDVEGMVEEEPANSHLSM